MSFIIVEQKVSAPYPFKFLDAISRVLLFVGIFGIPLMSLPFTRDAIDLPKEFLLYGIVLLCFILWLLRVTLARDVYVRRTILDIPIGIFLLMFIVASFASSSPISSWLGSASEFVLNVATVTAYVFVWWIFIQYIRNESHWIWSIYFFLISGVAASLLYLFRFFPLTKPFLSFFEFNTVSNLNSVFGVYIAIVGIVAFGFLLERGRRFIDNIIPCIASIASFLVLLRLGFSVSWVIFGVGMAMLLVFGFVFAAYVRLRVMSLVFFLFLASLLFIFTNTPKFFKDALPSEVALSPSASLNIGIESILSGSKMFLLGSGPGTFSRVFLKFRPAAFNMIPNLIESRFSHAYSAPFSLVVEVGFLGFLSFIFLVLFHFGAIIAGWSRAMLGGLDIEENIITRNRIMVFVPAIAWIAATIGMCLSWYSVALWWVWWWLLAMSMLGLSFFVNNLIYERTWLLDVSPQYSLALAFSMILLLSATAFFGIYAGRFYSAEIQYTLAVRTGNFEEGLRRTQTALDYRPSYAEYRLALASLYLEQAKIEAGKGSESSADKIAVGLSSAVNEAKIASESEPSNSAAWETLSLIYLNASALTADANEWAGESTKRAIELNPMSPELHWRLGTTYEFASKPEDAEKEYKKAIELKRDFVTAYVSLARLYEEGKHLDEAISVFQTIMPMLSNNSEGLFLLGRLFYNRNIKDDNVRAKELWDRAVELQPNYSNAIYGLGLLAERLGDTQSAKSYFERVRVLNPNNQDILKKFNQF